MVPSQLARCRGPPLGTTNSGPPAIAGESHAKAAKANRLRRIAQPTLRLTLRIGDAPVLDPVARDGAVQELAEGLFVDRSLARVEHLLLCAVEQRAIHRHSAHE